MDIGQPPLLGGNHSIAPAQARTYVDEYFAETTAAAAASRKIEELTSKRDAAVIGSFTGMSMVTMLAVLEDIRLDGKLDDLSDLIMPVPPDQRLMAALLSAGGHLGLRWRATVGTLIPAEVDEIRHFLFDRVIYADTFTPPAIVKRRAGDPDTGKPFARPPGADEMWPTTVDDQTWVDGFLHYFRLMKVPFDDKSMWFNEAQHPVEEIVDIAVEQARIAGRVIAPEAVQKVIEQNREHR